MKFPAGTRSILIGFLLYIVLSHPALGASVIGISIESLADTCPVIGVYSQAQVEWESAAKIDGYATAPIRAHLTKALRGEPANEIRFDFMVWSTPWQQPTELYAQDGDQFLVFEREASKGDLRVEAIISLSRPSGPQRWGGEHAVKVDFTVLTDGEAILRLVEDRIHTHPAAPLPWGKLWGIESIVEVPSASDAWSALFGGGAVLLRVPPDLEPISKQKLVEWDKWEKKLISLDGQERAAFFAERQANTMRRNILAACLGAGGCLTGIFLYARKRRAIRSATESDYSEK